MRKDLNRILNLHPYEHKTMNEENQEPKRIIINNKKKFV